MRRLATAATMSLLVLAGAALPAAAQPCVGEQDLLALSIRQLTERDGLTSIEGRRIGLDAAYLLLRYAPRFAARPDDLFELLDELGLQGREELAATWLISEGRVAEGLARLGADPQAALSALGDSSLRALLLHDDGATYFGLLSTALEAPDAARGPLLNDQRRARVTADLDDRALASLAAAALVHDLDLPAAQLLGSRSRLDLLDALVARADADPLVASLADPTALLSLTAAVRHDALAPRLADRPDWPDLLDISRAGYLDGEATWLAIFANQTGRFDEVAEVACLFITAVEEGVLSPAIEPEAAWLFQYRALADRVPGDLLQRALGSFELRARHLQALGGSALWLLNDLVAREALRDLAGGATRTPPARPASLSFDYPWEGWVEAAVAVAMGDEGRLDPALAWEAAELLADQGRYIDALASASRTLDAADRLRFAADLAERIDRACLGASASPGQALFRPGRTLFRF